MQAALPPVPIVMPVNGSNFGSGLSPTGIDGSAYSKETRWAYSFNEGTGMVALEHNGNITTWKTNVNLGERVSASGYMPPRFTGEAALLAARISQNEMRTEAQIKALERKLDLLTNALITFQPFSGTEEGEETAQEYHPPEMTNLTDRFNAFADGRVGLDGKLHDVVYESLTDKDPLLRAAAGRALGLMDPDEGRTRLAEMIEGEPNAMARAILEGARRAASL